MALKHVLLQPFKAAIDMPFLKAVSGRELKVFDMDGKCVVSLCVIIAHSLAQNVTQSSFLFLLMLDFMEIYK